MENRLLKVGVKEIIQPLLRECGFTRFQYPNAWRRLTDQTHVMNFQTFRFAEHFPLETAFSFCVNLGVIFHYVPCYYPEDEVKRRTNQPKEYEADIRCRLVNPESRYADTSFWSGDYVDNLEPLLIKTRLNIRTSALPWLDVWRNVENLIRALKGEDLGFAARVNGDYSSPWRLGSKGHRRMLGYAEHYAGHENPQVSLAEAEAIQQSFAESWRNPPGISKT